MTTYSYLSTMPTVTDNIEGVTFTAGIPISYSSDQLFLNKYVPARLDRYVDGVRSNADLVTNAILTQQLAYNYGIDTRSAEYYGVSYNATAAQNVANMNIALQKSRTVTLNTPGQYLIGGEGIKIPSNTTLSLGADVELILANQTFAPIISAERQFDPGIAATAAIAYGGSGVNFTGTITVSVNDTPHLRHPVGSWIAIGGLDLSNQANRSYQGVYQVSAVTTTTITYWMIDTPPSGGNSTTGARVYPADTGIRVIGGMWDGNGVNNSTSHPYYQGDPNSHIMSFRNTQDIIVHDVKFRRGYSWSIGTNNIRDATFRDLYGDLYGDGTGSANAIIQGSGGGRNVLIDGVSGTCEDNMVAWSLDTIGQNRTVSTPSTSWTYQNHDNGDVYNLRIRNVHSAKNNAAIVNFWGNTHARYHLIDIDGVTGRVSGGAMVGVDNGFDQTDMYNTNGGILKIKNVVGESSAPAVSLRSNGTWDLVEIDTVRMSRPVTATPAVTFTKRNAGAIVPPATASVAGTVQTIKRLVMKNIDCRIHLGTNNRTGPIAEITDTNIDELVVEGIPLMRINANTGIIIHSGTEGVIKQAIVSNVRGEVVGAFSDACLVKCDNSGAGAMGTLVLRDSSLVGFTDGTTRGGLVHQPAGKIVVKVRLDNTPIPAITKTGSVGGCIREGSGMTIDTVSVATL